MRQGEQFTVAHNGEPIAVLGPVVPPTRITPRELAAQIGDVPLPDEGFVDDIEAMRQTLPPVQPPAWSWFK